MAEYAIAIPPYDITKRMRNAVPDYRRYRVAGGTYFFTANLLERFPNDLLVQHIDLLRTVGRKVQEKRPFHIDAWVVLPYHLHCIWTLPTGDEDFTNRWRLIKQGFSKGLPITERLQRCASHAVNAACGNVGFGSM